LVTEGRTTNKSRQTHNPCGRRNEQAWS